MSLVLPSYPRALARFTSFFVLEFLTVSNSVLAAGDAMQGSTQEQEPEGPLSQSIDFTAGCVLTDTPMARWGLSDSVVLRVHRYRVTSDALMLERTPRGISVEGEGKVGFCPCAAPPISIWFRDATVAPPTDLLLQNASVRVGDVPIIWVPLLWLRSPNRFGLLPPKVAWRAEDGLLLSSGIHVPLSERTDAKAPTLNLLGGAYVRGGADARVELVTTHTATMLRWDTFEGDSLVQSEAHGSLGWGSSNALAWQWDTLRGARSYRGPVDFETSARRMDRARIEFGHDDGWSFALGVRTDAPRLGAIDAQALVTPHVRFGFGTGLGSFGSASSSVELSVPSFTDGRASPMLLHVSDLALSSRPGPVALTGALRERWIANDKLWETSNLGTLGGEFRAALPLTRRYGATAASSWTHWVEPWVQGTVALETPVAHRSGESLSSVVSTGQLGVNNILGKNGSFLASNLELRGGILSRDAQSKWGTAARWKTSGTYFGSSLMVAWADASGWLSSSRIRVGRTDRVSMRVRVEGRSQSDDGLMRWFFDEGWNPLLSRWFDREGWSSGGSLSWSLSDTWAIGGGTNYDWSSSSWLAHRGAITYRHPCGCLAMTTAATWRQGRDGWDIWGGIDLMP